ncbi:MAG: hypothetical protein WC382_06140 [Methanoregulaceae archaeon]|jgi:hypothetical protein
MKPESSIESLERYRRMGYDAIRHLPDAERERDKKMIDAAYDESVQMIREGQPSTKNQPSPAGPDDDSGGAEE